MYSDNTIYFRTDDPNDDDGKQLYCYYNIVTGDVGEIDTVDIFIEKYSDNNSSDTYTVKYDDGALSALAGGKMIITNNLTGETKELVKKDLESCEEGEKILAFGSIAASCFVQTYVKEDTVYFANLYITDGLLGDPCHCFIMKYDFQNNALEYHTSIYFKEYPERIVDMYIP